MFSLTKIFLKHSSEILHKPVKYGEMNTGFILYSSPNPTEMIAKREKRQILKEKENSRKKQNMKSRPNH